MPAKQAQKRSSVKKNTKSSQPPRKTQKADYLQFTEARYKKMSDKEFVKAFEEGNKNEDMSYTQVSPNLFHFSWQISAAMIGRSFKNKLITKKSIWKSGSNPILT